MVRALAIASLAIATIAMGVLAQQPGAMVMFYNPAGTESNETEPRTRPARLRPIRFAAPFPSRGNVGVHYWFEDAQGVSFTASGAAKTGGRFFLHVRNNVGHGFLTAWLIEGEGGVELTPRSSPHAGVPLGEQDYVVPGEFRFKPGAGLRSVILVFSRSQTEQSGSPAGARANLKRILAWRWQNGPQVITESDETTTGQIGTYVVNQVGAPVAAEIVLR